MSSHETQVVIIGAGISGLSAATLLNREGISVQVLEANDRVGGRTFTIHVRDAAFDYTDIGGAYVGPCQRKLGRKLYELGLKLYKIDARDLTVLSIKDKYMKYHGTIPDIWNPIVLMDVNNLMSTIDNLTEEVPLEAPWKAPRAKEWDSITVKQFVDKHAWTSFGAKTIQIFAVNLFCAELHEISFLFFLWYIKSACGTHRSSSVENGAQEQKVVGGTQQICKKMANILNDKVHLNQVVVKVTQRKDGISVVTSDGNVYMADYVISAMPVSLLNRVEFEPSLSPKRQQLIQRMPMGCIIKTVMFYERRFWKAKGLSGQMISDEGPVQYCVDDTKPDGTYPAIMGFVQANNARDLMNLSQAERKQKIASHYAKIFRCDEFLKPCYYVEYNWASAQYSGGCYSAVMPPGILTQYGAVLREPCGRIYWAGTETAKFWAGYMDGAVEAGERAAREIMCRMGMISPADIWKEDSIPPNLPEPPVIKHQLENLLPSVGKFILVCCVVLAIVIKNVLAIY